MKRQARSADGRLPWLERHPSLVARQSPLAGRLGRLGTIAFALLLCQGVCLLFVPGASAAEQFKEFLQALQDRGYGDTAADYLTQIRSRNDVPDDLREVLDLQMATSLRIAAANTPNADEAARDLGAAQRFLDKFVHEHPDHAESGTAYATYGDLASARAEAWLKTALVTRDKDEQESLLTKARSAFQKARSAYDRGRQACQGWLDRSKTKTGPKEKAPPADKPAHEKTAHEKTGHIKPGHESPKAEVETVEGRLVQARFKLVMVDYQMAKTWLDTASPQRKEALQQAATGFDDIYQRYRTFQAGLYAHFWHGKTLVELGDMTTALDVFDEVLANAPDPHEKGDDASFDEQFAELFANVEQMRLTILSRQGHADDVIAEAEEWLRSNKSNHNGDGYQGVALELAKAQLAKAEGQTGEARRKSTQAIKVALAKIAARPNAHQQEAILMQRQLRAQGGDTEPTSFDEAVAIADAATAANDREGAVLGYERAIGLARDSKKASKINDVRLRLARAQWSAGKTAECLDTAERLIGDDTAAEQAPAAAGLAIHAALKLASATRDSGDAQKRLSKVADAIIRRWPQSVEADEARMALGKLALLKGDDAQALAVFDGVNSASQRYPSALHWSAVVHWRRYLKAKEEPQEKRGAAAISAERANAVSQLKASLKAQEATAGSGVPPRELMESQVLLAEIDLEGGRAEDAAAVVAPLVATIRALPPREQDTLALRGLIAALKANLLCKDMAHAEEAAVVLMERGGNAPQVGAVLLEFARQLRGDIKQAATEQRTVKQDTAEGEKPVEGVQIVSAEAAFAENGSAVAGSAPAESGPSRESLLLAKLLDNLAQRPQASAAAVIFVAETLAELGKADEARAQYQAILERAEKDAKWLQVDRSVKTRARAKILSFLRAEGKYEQALAQADRLIQENPKAMEPRMERAQILQSWAETQPERYRPAVAQWTELRTALQNVRPRPKEYYDVIYNAAWCLAAQSEHNNDAMAARQAEQLLKSLLILSPSLDGPETVAKYNALVERCQSLQTLKKTKSKKG